MNLEKKRERFIKSIETALDELDKLINQEIDLTALDPEKAKAAAQGKLEAIEGTKKLLETLGALLGEEEKVVEKKKDSWADYSPEKFNRK